MSNARGAVFGCSLCLALAWAPDALADPETHDGFYMQFGLGMGYLSVTETLPAVAGFMDETDINYTGMTIPSHFLLGGSPIPGLVIGGGFIEDYAFSPSASAEGMPAQELEDISLYLIGIGPFVAFYPDAESGLHFDAFFGWGGLEASRAGDVSGSDPTGLVMTIGGGYEFWVGSEWSIGPMFRLAYAPLSLNDVSYTTIAPALLATFTYH